MKTPLGIPKGSVRSILALTIIISGCFFFLFGSYFTQIDIYKFLVSEYKELITYVVIFYFTTRNSCCK